MKVYVIYDVYDRQNMKVAFAERADAEEYILSLAEEAEFNWFCDLLINGYWAIEIKNAKDVFSKWKQYQDEDKKNNMSLSGYVLSAVGDYYISEVEVY